MPDYSSFYATLGASPDTDWKTLRARYKRLIGQWHPDRFSTDPNERKIAEERSKQITIAYQALDRYRRDHDGELPRAEPAKDPADERAPMPDADARFHRTDSTTHAKAAPTGASAPGFGKRVPRRRHRAVIAFAAVVAVAYFGNRFIEAWSHDDTPSAESADTSDRSEERRVGKECR